MIYYFVMFGLDKLYVSYMKLALAQPRPYMVQSSIVPISCSRAFGDPSGHSSASIIIGMVLFLDTFHGKTTKGCEPFYYGNKMWQYYLALFLAVFWATTIPFTRFLLGAHSLDQIIYGITLGIWGGLTCHFVIRDHLIEHIENALDAQDLLHPLDDIDTKEKINLDEIKPQVDQADEYKAEGGESALNPFKPCMTVFCVWAAFELVAIITFIFVNRELSPESEALKMWKKNYEKSCGELDMTYALQNACLNSCGYLTIPMVIYISTMYRNKSKCFKSAQI